jgi:hypothetical protein
LKTIILMKKMQMMSVSEKTNKRISKEGNNRQYGPSGGRVLLPLKLKNVLNDEA